MLTAHCENCPALVPIDTAPQFGLGGGIFLLCEDCEQVLLDDREAEWSQVSQS